MPSKLPLRCRCAFLPQVVAARPAGETEETKQKVLKQGEPKQFESDLNMPQVAILRMLGYAMQFFLHRNPLIAEKQVAHLNAALAQLEFFVEVDDDGGAVLNSRERANAPQ